LEQEENGIRRPVAYYSRKLSPAEQRYTTRERECLAVKQCLLVWRHYLLGAPFTVRSDHESLKWLQTQNVDTLSDRLLRWLEYLSLFDFKQEYIPGEHNVFPDHLSRPAEHRPATQVILGSGALNEEQLDLPALVNLLQIDQRCGTAFPVLEDMVLPDSEVHSTFYDQIVTAQRADAEIQTIVSTLQDSAKAPSCEFRTLFAVRDGVLGVPEPDGSWRLVIPDGNLRSDICRFFHDEAGHPGTQRTLLAICRYFYWPNMSRSVARYVASCSACQAAKASNRRAAGFSEPVAIPAEPATDWTIDFLELPKSANGFSCVLVCTERLSKLVVLVPMSNTTTTISATEVARAFVDNVICWFGVPAVLFSDRGPQFRSAVWHEIWKLLGSSVKHSTPHTPHSHGDVERQNRIINEMLRTMLQTQFADMLPRWDEHMKVLQFAMNSAFVTRTGMTPLYFFFGRHPRVPASLTLPHSSLDHRSLEFAASFQNRVQQARDLGRAGQISMIRSMDKKRDPSVQFRVGASAWVRSEMCPIPGDKHFLLPWAGPFPILAVSPSTATLDIPEHWRTAKTFHFDKLALYRPRPPEVGPSLDPPQPVLLPDGTSWYEVESVVRHAWRGRRNSLGQRKLYYLVKFKGYSAAFNAWHSAESLVQHGANPIIAHYHELYNVPRPPMLEEPGGGEVGVGGV